ncbi:hypothetical protein DYY67_1131 [Candidatus Nitrosotalea sp. TS]|nr:hypothetical protein [Candidatus Nitrosotalea sp. TS]
MQYHQAVRIGQERSRKSQMTLFEHAGFAMLTLTVKKIPGDICPSWRKGICMHCPKARGLGCNHSRRGRIRKSAVKGLV